jgi:hypothetical protein
LPRSHASQRASRYRKRGVKLKQFPGERGRHSIDVDAINAALAAARKQ